MAKDIERKHNPLAEFRNRVHERIAAVLEDAPSTKDGKKGTTLSMRREAAIDLTLQGFGEFDLDLPECITDDANVIYFESAWGKLLHIDTPIIRDGESEIGISYSLRLPEEDSDQLLAGTYRYTGDNVNEINTLVQRQPTIDDYAYLLRALEQQYSAPKIKVKKTTIIPFSKLPKPG